MPTPGVQEAAVTGILAPEKGADEFEDMSIEELKAAKPAFVYYFVQDMQDFKDENYKFSRRFEMGLQEKTITAINEDWAAKKIGLDLEADREEEKNQARIELWSATGVHMKTISTSKRDQKLLNAGPLQKILKKYERESDRMVAKQIDLLEKLAKDTEKESAAK